MKSRAQFAPAAVLLIFFCVVASSLGAEESVRARFDEANGLYAGKRYAEALEIYSELVREGVQSPQLYYNLGNAHYKCGKIGRAIQYYEKARKLLPRDRDISENLAFAKRQVSGEEENPGFLRMILSGTVFSFTVKELVALESASALLLSVCGVIAVRARARIPGIVRVGLVVFGILVLVSLLFLSVHFLTGRTDRAIVLERVEAMSGPGDDFVRILSIPEGTMVWVDEERENWRLIHLATGRGGWVRNDGLGLI
jgi:hypothetical protein